VRVIAGVYDYITSPAALRALHGAGLLKVAVPEHNKIFHPKLYLFKTSGGDVCWIGSANLTCKGFGENVELIHEHTDAEEARAWFDAQWKLWPAPKEDWLNKYEDRAKKHALAGPSLGQMEPPPLAGSPFADWPSYYAALKEKDKAWLVYHRGEYGILNGKNSYVGVLHAARPLIEKDWSTLTDTEARVLLGWKDGATDYGLLGSMVVAATAGDVFRKSTPSHRRARREIQRAVLDVLRAKLASSFPSIVQKAYEVITNHDGFNRGVATRLLTLARPEALVSVNNKSLSGLAALNRMLKKGS
jgi:hypothetical protein